MTTVRKTKLAGELVGGDWLAADEYYPTPVRVLAVHTYLDHGSPSALITAVGPNNMPFSFDRFADAYFSLATEPEIAATTSRGHRQQIVTELLLLAEILGQAPAPVERTVLIQLHADSRAEVRAIGAHLGIEPEKRYRDGLQVTWPKGRQAYDDGVCVLWYTDKAEDDEPAADPAVLAQVVELIESVPDDPTGLAYTRADDDAEDPTRPGPREPMHNGGMTEDGLVDETDDGRCPDCGESLRQIALGTLGHIPGEACASAETPEQSFAIVDSNLRAMGSEGLTPAEPRNTAAWAGAPGLVAYTETAGLIVGDTATEQRDNAYAAYERDEAECPSAWHVNQGDKRSRCPICNQAD